MFLGELALELRMPVGELGQRMSAWELNVFWPCFFEVRRREQERDQAEAERESKMKRSRTIGGGR